MDFDDLVVKDNPGLCRCCLSEGCYKDLSTEYTWMNDTEVYADMLLECFDISISQHNDGPNGSSRLICEVCITRLRDACNFKKQVLDSETRFIDMLAKGEFQSRVLVYQPMKAENQEVEEATAEENDGEVEYLDEEMEYDEEDDLPLRPPQQAEGEPSSSNTATLTIIKGKRGRPRKDLTPVKSEKKPKLEEKSRTAKGKEDPNSANKISTKEKLLIMRQNVLQVVLNSTALPFRWLRSCFRCFYCYEIFIEPKDLKIHSNIHLYNEKYETVGKFMETVVYIDVSNLSCRLCPYDIKDLYKLIEHFEEKHQISFNKEIGLCMYPFRLNDNSFDCCECDANFRSFSHLLRHTNKAHKGFCDILCDLCGQHFKNKNLLKQHIVKTHERKPRKCSQCDVIITNPNHLRTHMQRYHGKKYKCFMCSEDFSTHYQRSQHMMNIHQDKQLTCPHCPRTFVFKSIMQRHVRETHLHEKNVECPVCGWQAFEANRLQRHMMKHSNERNFKCDMCEKAFKTRKTMRQHFMNIHEKVKITLPEGMMQS